MQLSFNFDFSDTKNEQEFVISDANSAAWKFINNYDSSNPNLPKIFALCGNQNCGKTTLARIWQKKMDAEFLSIKKLKNSNLINVIDTKSAYIIEDIDENSDEKTLLHIFNLINEKLDCLMLTSKKSLSQIDFKVKDLSSRMNNVFSIAIKNPDEELINLLLVKFFSDKQLNVEKRVIDFLVKNLPREYLEIFNFVKMVEFYVFEEKRKLTINFCKEILQKTARRIDY